MSRPEATWIYSALLFLKKLGEKMGKKIKVNAWTGNMALVRRMNKILQNNPPTLYSKNDSDLMSGVSYLMKEIEIEIKHVKGHQDSQGRKLKREEELNMIANELAAIALNEERKAKSQDRNGPQLIIEGRIITSNVAKEPRQAAE